MKYSPYISKIIGLKSETEAVIDNLIVKPNRPQIFKINTLVELLKKSNWWDNLDCVQSYFGYDELCTINWKSPAGTKGQLLGGANVAVDKVVTGGTDYIDTGFIPNTATQLSLDDALILSYMQPSVPGTAFSFGTSDGDSTIGFIPRSGSGTHKASANGSDTIPFQAPGIITTGLHGLFREDSLNVKTYSEGAQVASQAQDSTFLSQYPIYLGSRNNNGSVAGIIQNRFYLFLAGSARTQADRAALNSIVNHFISLKV